MKVVRNFLAISLLAAAFGAQATPPKSNDTKPMAQAGALAVSASSAKANAKQSQHQGQGQGQGQSMEGSNNAGLSSANTVTLTGDVTSYAAQERNPVSTAYAPSFAATAVCALGASGGAQGAAFGITIGGSYIDKNCELLEQVRAAQAIGARDVALEMMQDVPAFAAASKRLADRKQKSSAAPGTGFEPAPTATVKAEYTDPIIRKRLGLQPL